MLLHAARAERTRRRLPLRQRDAQQLADLERTLHPPSGATSVDRSFNDLVVEMTR
jgi:hypothetical protein